MMEFSLDVLSALIADSTVRGLSITRELQPLGGRGDTVSPPTFAQPEGGEKGPRYVWSERRIGDAMVKTCLLDSSASQANRLEESLLEFVRAGMLTSPPSSHGGSVHRAELTDLELPHRTLRRGHRYGQAHRRHRLEEVEGCKADPRGEPQKMRLHSSSTHP